MSKRYPLLNIDDTTPLRCIVVLIPDDSVAEGVFWQSFEFLTKWVAWERDPDRKARDIALVWRRAFIESREMNNVIVRDVYQDDEMPCMIWKEYCNGDIELVADMKQCIPSTYQYPVPPEGSTSEKAVAADLVVYLQHAMQSLIDIMNQTDDRVHINRLLRSYFPSEIIWDGSIVFDQMITIMLGIGQEQRQEEFDDADWQGMYEKLACSARDQGFWLDDAVEQLFQFLNESSNQIFHTLNVLGQVITTGSALTALAGLGHGAGGGGVGFEEPVCGWEVIYDFSNGFVGWDVEYVSFYTDNSLCGEWDNGKLVSEQTGYVQGGYHYLVNLMVCSIEWTNEVEINSISVDCEFTGNTFEALRLYLPPYGAGDIPNSVLHVWNKAYGQIYDERHMYTYNATLVTNKLGFAMYSNNGGNDPGNQVYCYRVTIRGIGDEPKLPD